MWMKKGTSASQTACICRCITTYIHTLLEEYEHEKIKNRFRPYGNGYGCGEPGHHCFGS